MDNYTNYDDLVAFMRSAAQTPFTPHYEVVEAVFEHAKRQMELRADRGISTSLKDGNVVLYAEMASGAESTVCGPSVSLNELIDDMDYDITKWVECLENTLAHARAIAADREAEGNSAEAIYKRREALVERANRLSRQASQLMADAHKLTAK